MPGCEDFEIAIEMRLHGALGDAEGARLDAHLPTCERCRAFQATARRTEAVMHEAASEAMRAVDWAAVERAIGRWRRRSRLVAGMLVVLTLVLLAQLVAWTRQGSQALEAPIAFGAALLALAAIGFDRWRRGRRLAQAGHGPETLALLRRDVAMRGRAIRTAMILFPLQAAFFGWQAFDRAEAPRQALIYGGCALLALVALLFLWFVKRPRLLRERAELGGGDPSP